MTKCELKLLRDLEKLLGQRKVVVTTDSDYSLFLKAGELLDQVVIEAIGPATINIGTTDGGTEIVTDTFSGSLVLVVNYYTVAGEFIYFSGYDPELVKLKLYIK